MVKFSTRVHIILSVLK